MPDPRDGKCGKMPPLLPGGGGGGGGWALLELTDALESLETTKMAVPYQVTIHFLEHLLKQRETFFFAVNLQNKQG